MMNGVKERNGSEMNAKAFYLREVYPQLNLPLTERYPHARLTDDDGWHALADHDMVMLVALTGAGKSTTLAHLRRRLSGLEYDVIPSRREVADWIAIPLAQHWSRAPFNPEPDRVRRFELTRLFARRVAGGMAAAFSWLNLADAYSSPVLCEGIRGRGEIRHVLTRFPRWRIVELALDPLTRLRRLSKRQEAFDRAAGTADVSFLPPALRTAAIDLVEAGEISASALSIVRAEAANYGLYAFDDGAAFPHYHRLDVDGASAEEVAAAVLDVVEPFEGCGWGAPSELTEREGCLCRASGA